MRSKATAKNIRIKSEVARTCRAMLADIAADDGVFHG